MDELAAPPDIADAPAAIKVLTGEDEGDRVATQVEIEAEGRLLVATRGERTPFARYDYSNPPGKAKLTFGGGRAHVHATDCFSWTTPNGLCQVEATSTLRDACELLHVLRGLGWMLEGDDAMEARWMAGDSPEPADFAPPAAASDPAPPGPEAPATPPPADPAAPGGPATT